MSMGLRKSLHCATTKCTFYSLYAQIIIKYWDYCEIHKTYQAIIDLYETIAFAA